MGDNKRLLAVMAHPDDESLGLGCILTKYKSEGVETYLVTATRGERGWFGEPGKYPGEQALGEIREGELMNAAKVLGLCEVNFLDQMDGDLDQVDPEPVIAKIAAHIRRIRPQVVVTFDPSGWYGHPDHIAISQFTTAAVVAAADASFDSGAPYDPYRVLKLYYMAPTACVQEVYQQGFGDLVMHIDGIERRATPWEDWAVTTRIESQACVDTVWQAISQHCTQLPGYQALLDLPREYLETVWGAQTFYRAFSLVNGGRQIETDLFEGLNGAEPR